KKSGGFLSKKTTHTISEDSASREAGSLLSGNRVTVNAGDNLTVEGSDVVAEREALSSLMVWVVFLLRKPPLFFFVSR
ncbi:hypothetical protein ACD968_26160, partial [Escherichia coli]